MNNPSHIESRAVLDTAKGEFLLTVTDSESGEELTHFRRRQVITLDAGLLVARLLKDPEEPSNGMNMLGVGSGALGPILQPDAPTNEQRSLQNEIARKPFSDTTFRDANGAAVAIPTNVVDFTTIFGEGEAVGPLNEMGVLSTISDNVLVHHDNPNRAGQGGEPYDPAIDTANYDVLCNYLTFGVVTKPIKSILTITWRFTF